MTEVKSGGSGSSQQAISTILTVAGRQDGRTTRRSPGQLRLWHGKQHNLDSDSAKHQKLLNLFRTKYPADAYLLQKRIRQSRNLYHKNIFFDRRREEYWNVVKTGTGRIWEQLEARQNEKSSFRQLHTKKIVEAHRRKQPLS